MGPFEELEMVEGEVGYEEVRTNWSKPLCEPAVVREDLDLTWWLFRTTSVLRNCSFRCALRED